VGGKVGKKNFVLFLFETMVQLWSLFLFLLIIYKYFFGTSFSFITITRPEFYLTGLVSLVSTIVLYFVRSRK
ncbi:hypothetical protein N2H33_13590, partial [Enterococcus faecium]|nr:hypothetical protein [Enterococcus faecium]